MDVNDVEKDIGHQPRKEVKNQKSGVAHPVFHTPSEKVKKPHIAYDVEPASMEKHVGQKGKIVL
jgi:hypothetical protein